MTYLIPILTQTYSLTLTITFKADPNAGDFNECEFGGYRLALSGGAREKVGCIKKIGLKVLEKVTRKSVISSAG